MARPVTASTRSASSLGRGQKRGVARGGEPVEHHHHDTHGRHRRLTTGSRRISRLDGSDRRNSGGLGSQRMSAVAHAGPDSCWATVCSENPPQVALWTTEYRAIREPATVPVIE